MSNSAVISQNIGWHLKQILAGRLGLAEFSARALIMPEFSSKAKLLGLKPELLVTVMSQTVLNVLNNHKDKVLSDRTPNAHIKQLFRDEFKAAYLNYAKLHPAYASETLRTLYLDSLSEQREQIEADTEIFNMGLQAGAEKQQALPLKTLEIQYPNLKALETAATADPDEAEHVRRVKNHGKRVPFETIDKAGEPGIVICPNCGKPGIRCLYEKAGVFIDSIRHRVLKDDGVKGFVHSLRQVDPDTANILRQEYKQAARAVKVVYGKQITAAQATTEPEPKTEQAVAAAVKPKPDHNRVICTICGEPGMLTERVIRDSKRMTYERAKVVVHAGKPYHRLETLERRRLTDAEAADVRAGKASKGRLAALEQKKLAASAA